MKNVISGRARYVRPRYVGPLKVLTFYARVLLEFHFGTTSVQKAQYEKSPRTNLFNDEFDSSRTLITWFGGPHLIRAP